MDHSDLIGDVDVTDLVEVDPPLSDRHELFCKTYVSNGFNATQAYIAVGYSPDGADHSASRLLRKESIRNRIAELKAPRDKLLKEKLASMELTLEATLAQIAAVTQFDQRKLFYPNGEPIPMHLLDDATSAAISHIGKHGPVPFSKMVGLDMAMKYLGAYEKDNAQKAPSLTLSIDYE